MFFLTRSALRLNTSTVSNLLGFWGEPNLPGGNETPNSSLPVKVRAQGQRLAKRLRPDHRTIAPFTPQPHTQAHHHITKALVTAVPFTQYITSTFQQKNIRMIKGKKHSLKR